MSKQVLLNMWWEVSNDVPILYRGDIMTKFQKIIGVIILIFVVSFAAWMVRQTVIFNWKLCYATDLIR